MCRVTVVVNESDKDPEEMARRTRIMGFWNPLFDAAGTSME